MALGEAVPGKPIEGVGDRIGMVRPDLGRNLRPTRVRRIAQKVDEATSQPSARGLERGSTFASDPRRGHGA